MKRQDYISWDEYFMGIAILSAERSKDNNSQVGACIVSPNNKIFRNFFLFLLFFHFIHDKVNPRSSRCVDFFITDV